MSYISFVYRRNDTGEHVVFDADDPAHKEFKLSDDYDDCKHIATINHAIILQRLYDAIGGIYESH